jgi:glycosyltransferase involved in cell wall biosynthesis
VNKLVSIIIPTYNGYSRGFLQDSIESVLGQTYKNFELIIVDDGSTDDTDKLCKMYAADMRVKYFLQDNSGVATARNNGIKFSAGDYICFLDDDDVWLENKLEKQVEFYEKANKRVGLCYTGLEIIDKTGRRTGAVQANHADGDVFTQMLCENLVNCTSSVMIPRYVFSRVGLFKKHLSYAEDYDLWLRIAKKYFLYSIDEVLVLYREHGKNTSANLDEIDFYALRAVFKHTKDDSIYNKFYKKRAAYRFWLGDYKVFRRYVKFASAYGRVGLKLRARVFLSYFPRLIIFLRVFLKKLRIVLQAV